jgi:Mg2+-importing ATPase
MLSKDFFVDQSSLTGESFPVEKHADVLGEKSAGLTELTNTLFCGSNVVTGTAEVVVVKTGKETQFGRIVESMGEEAGSNEFTRGIGSFSLMILRLVMFFVLFIFLANALIKHDIYQSLMFSIAVAVGLTPEFLPMIMSVNMGKGSIRMAKKGVIVKKLTAIPTFGSMDILCTDKTGTITVGKIHLVMYIDFFGQHSDKVLLKSYINSFYQTGITNPLDEAILTYKKLDVSDYKKLDEIPFDFLRRRISVIAEKGGNRALITKGAPEEIFKICKYYDNKGKKEVLDDKAASSIAIQYYALSNDGYRVIAVAEKDGLSEKKVYEKDEEKDLSLLGFVAFLDPPKQDVKENITKLEKLGIEFKILTGDNELVTQKICRDIGVKIRGVMVGSEMEKISDSALKQRVKETTIFARFSPEDKNRVINALKSNGHVVGYMGDGINDAVSLKNADVGISVDNATDVAKESADIILTKKSLDILKDGVIEGRKSFGNTMKYIMMGMGSNFGNMFSVLGALFFLPYLPMLPVQILLNNFLYDIAQVTIPTDNVDEEFTASPKKWDIKFIRNFMYVFGPISSVYDYLTFIVLFYIFGLSASAFHTGWFMESIATQTLVILIIRTRKIPFVQSKPSKALLISATVAVLVAWILPLTILGKDLGFEVLPLKIVLTLVVIVFVYLINVEVAKRFFYKKYRY